MKRVFSKFLPIFILMMLVLSCLLVFMPSSLSAVDEIGTCGDTTSLGGANEGGAGHEWSYNIVVNGTISRVRLNFNQNAKTSSSLNQYTLWINGNGMGSPNNWDENCTGVNNVMANWSNIGLYIDNETIFFELWSTAVCNPGMLYAPDMVDTD
ncbi:unnamed protein product, partial [marine sediment metagenome]